MKRIFMHYPDQGAQGWYRSLAPVLHCKQQLRDEGIELLCGESLTSADLDNFDAFIFHRAVMPSFMPVIQGLINKGKKIAWELDDDIWHIPYWNPASFAYDRNILQACDWMLEFADVVCVSTEPLAKLVGDKAKVCPNLIAESQWWEPEELSGQTHEEVRILWAGSAHHEKDIEILVEPLERILAEVPDVVIYFFGAIPYTMTVGSQIPKSSRVGFIHHTYLERYVPTLLTLQPDIALAPLCDHVFNDSKSGIKFMEMAMAGAAVIASDSLAYAPFRDVGLLVKEDWYKAMKRLIEDVALRKELAAAGKQKVLTEHSWGSRAKEKWMAFFRSLC